MNMQSRNTPALVRRIEKLRDDLLRRFQTVVGLSGIRTTDRNVTAITQYQIQVETASLISAAQDAQGLIRELQEMWLFGQLDTLDDNRAQKQTNEDAKAVSELLQSLIKLQQRTTSTEIAVDNLPIINGT